MWVWLAWKEGMWVCGFGWSFLFVLFIGGSLSFFIYFI